MEIAILETMGLILAVLGCVLWKKQKITILHDYHRDNVLDSDKKAFCKISGIGILVIGIGLVLSGIIVGITDSAYSFIAFGAGFVIGMIMLIYAGIRYNR